jgi:hypothetical protein
VVKNVVKCGFVLACAFSVVFFGEFFFMVDLLFCHFAVVGFSM